MASSIQLALFPLTVVWLYHGLKKVYRLASHLLPIVDVR